MRKSIAILVVSWLAALFAADVTAFAQAGSTGGTLGKTDKSASGGEGTSRRKNAVDSSASLTGNWQWRAECPVGGPYFGSFRLAQTSAGRLTGEFLDDSGPTKTGRITGTVTADKVSFTREGGGRVIQYNAVLNSSSKPHRMVGTTSESSIVGGCSFTASRV
jgi:hypothetical protein